MDDCEACKGLPDEFPGCSIKEIPELRDVVERVSIDSVNWVTIYRCKFCSQLWEERYEATGHGEVASVRKIKQ